jgi:hypothetical protein
LYYFPHPDQVRPPADRYTLTEDRRAGSERFHYRLLHPRWWKPLLAPPAVDGGAPVVPLGELGPPEQPTTRVRLSSWIFPLEIEAADWHRDVLSRRGDELLGERRIEHAERGASLDLLTRGPTPQGTVISRSIALKTSGPPDPRITLIEAHTLEEHYSTWADDLAVMLDSFALRRPMTFPYLESLSLYARGRPGDFSTYLPQSWKPVDVHTSPRADGWHLTHFVLAPNADAPLGRITLIVSGAAREERELFEPFLASLRPHALELAGPGPLPSFGGLEAVQGLAGHAHVRGDVGPDGKRQETRLWVRAEVGRRGSHLYLLGLVGIHPEVERRAAAIGGRAFELAKQHLRTADVR